ncbi:methyltransferase [Pseudodesulfovibrio piezophilus]|uniref:Putative Methyltransferase type 12 n=1 Tax=Pseudodesulfovibrio piezophilus (strain DSM 21447 / JCM 15486 / C1TLV30) TaxID=1322246 RepID=M1WS14_PSEP2|nr:methyltransferase [Pseudodesulfovibrio piezophilus]CCH48667.1 putative Methyltransferase type 12 [Pseudodesulfovibrio piezophilus C1TLV30]
MSFPNPKASLAPIENTLMEAVSAHAILDSIELGIFDHLNEAPLTAHGLAEKLGLKEKPLEALLDVLVTKKLLEHPGTEYANSLMAQEYMVSSSPLFQGAAMTMQARFNETMRQGFRNILKEGSLKRNEVDENWGEYETMLGTYQHALNGQIQGTTAYLAALPEFPSFRSMADVGGNHGQYSMELLERNPDLKSTLYDFPAVVSAASQRCKDRGFADRLTCTEFDLRADALPRDSYDLIFFSHILYGCKDDLHSIFTMAKNALKTGGCLVSQHFAPEGGASELYKTNVELLTRLLGYDTHFIARAELEDALLKTGFGQMEHTFTGVDGQSLLLIARKSST